MMADYHRCRTGRAGDWTAKLAPRLPAPWASGQRASWDSRSLVRKCQRRVTARTRALERNGRPDGDTRARGGNAHVDPILRPCLRIVALIRHPDDGSYQDANGCAGAAEARAASPPQPSQFWPPLARPATTPTAAPTRRPMPAPFSAGPPPAPSSPPTTIPPVALSGTRLPWVLNCL